MDVHGTWYKQNAIDESTILYIIVSYYLSFCDNRRLNNGLNWDIIHIPTEGGYCVCSAVYLISFYQPCRSHSKKQQVGGLTLILLMWRIWWTPNNAGKWQMGFNLVFKGLNLKNLKAQFKIQFQGLSGRLWNSKKSESWQSVSVPRLELGFQTTRNECWGNILWETEKKWGAFPSDERKF